MARRRLDARQRDRVKQLVWPYLPVLLRTARYLTRRDDEAEDLAQETLLKAMTAIDSFQPGTDMKAWLMTILRHTHIDRIRAAQRHPGEVSLDAYDSFQMEANDETEPGQFDDQWDQPDQMLNRFEDDVMIQALKALPEPIRWTLLLVDVEQLQLTEAAEILDVPLGTIKSRAHRGRQMLRDRLFDVAQERGWIRTPEPSE